MVEAHEGTIEIVDTPGWSTTFRVHLPLAERALAPPPPPGTDPGAPVPNGPVPNGPVQNNPVPGPPGAGRTRDPGPHPVVTPGPAGPGPQNSGDSSGTSPRWAKARWVATRPLGVRWMQTLLEQERLVGVLDGVGLLADALAKGGQADRLAPEPTAQGVEDGPVHLVQAELVHPEQGQPLGRGRVR